MQKWVAELLLNSVHSELNKSCARSVRKAADKAASLIAGDSADIPAMVGAINDGLEMELIALFLRDMVERRKKFDANTRHSDRPTHGAGVLNNQKR